MLYLFSLLALALGAGPSGHYVGTKTVLFNHIKVDMQTVSDGFFSLAVTGAPSGDVNCPKEAYTLQNGALEMTNYGTAGDCATDQFKAAKLTFNGATYDETADTITVKAKYLFVSVTIVAKKLAVEALLATEPQGHYFGTKKVMGYHVSVDMATSATPGTFSLAVKGAPGGDVNCPTEKYVVSGTDLSMPGYVTAGDCAHDQFKKAHLKFLGATYDAATDTITMHAKYLFIKVTIVAQKQSSVLETRDWVPTQLATAPNGHYAGTKTVLGYHVSVDMATLDEAGYFSLKVTGAPGGNVDCEKEAYTVTGTDLAMPGYETAGDCAHDQFQKAHLKFLGATYDAAADTITMHAKYLFVKVTIVAQKQALTLPLAVPCPPFECVPTAFATAPNGHYFGTKKVLGYKVQVDMSTQDAGFFSLKVTGAPGGNVNCPKEAYTVTGTDLAMPGYVTAGDCAHDQFQAAHLKFLGATYDAATDTITMHAKYLFVKVTIVAQKQQSGESLAPLTRILNRIAAAN